MNAIDKTACIEGIAEELVLTDAADLQAIAKLIGRIDALRAEAEEMDEATMALAAKSASGALTTVVFGESTDVAATMEEAGRHIAQMQHILLHGEPAASTPVATVSQPEPATEAASGAVATTEVSGGPANGTTTCSNAILDLQEDPELKREFIAEALEHLEKADQFLLTLSSCPGDEDAVNTVFRAFHTIKGSAGFLQLNEILSAAHAAETLLDKVRKHEIEFCGSVMDVVFDAVDMLRRLVKALGIALETGELSPEPELPALISRLKAAASGEIPAASAPAKENKKLGVLLVEAGAAHPEAVKSVVCEQMDAEFSGMRPQPLGESLIKKNLATSKDVAAALRRQAPAAQSREAIRVDAERLDRLVNLVGELVISEAMVGQAAAVGRDGVTQYAEHLSQLNKITRELQDVAMSLRMVPVRGTFQKMARLVHDLSRKSGKETEFVTQGDDTELDKNVVDLIGDPLMHMIRNSVDHGIEDSPEERVRCGKPAAGRVELRAFHKGGNIHIEIQDDGRGLDREKILAKARERGLIREGTVLSDREVWNLIFLPGFSTAKAITDVSGRGVGMDVVKRNVAALRGQIEVQSVQGTGTTISIRLPLTLAIIDGMVVRVGAERYILPMTSITLSTRPDAKQIHKVAGRGEMVVMQDHLIPLYRLHRLLDTPGAQEDPTRAIVVIVEDDGRRVGLLADELIGQQQTVIKSLGDVLRGLPGIAGGAIMPDGQVGLILDVAGLYQLANEERAEESFAHAAAS